MINEDSRKNAPLILNLFGLLECLVMWLISMPVIKFKPPSILILTVPRRCFCCGSYLFVIIICIMFACCMTLWPL